MFIKPSVGRVVWYREVGEPEDSQPQAATVAFVQSDGLLNLSVVEHDGNVRPKTGVPLVQEGGAAKPEAGGYCEWMPFQIGQQKRTEEAEAKVAKKPAKVAKKKSR